MDTINDLDKRCSNCFRCDDPLNDMYCPDCGENKKWFISRALSAERINPPHYTRFKIQPTKFCVENNLNFLEGNIIKYICRYPFKGGVMDLKKAAAYLTELINRAEVTNGRVPA